MRQDRPFSFLLICATLLLSLLPATLKAQDTANMGIQLKEAAICRSIVNRTPIGRGSVFPAGIERLYCFTKVVGAKTETAIVHHWYLNGMLKASVTLPVRSATWRTWSSKDIKPSESGDWMVEVLTADGDAMESILFLVK